MPLSSSSQSFQSSHHGKPTTTTEEDGEDGEDEASPPPSPFQLHSNNIGNTTLPTTQSQRTRASSSPDPHLSASFSARVRSRTNTQSRKPPRQLHLPLTPITGSQSPDKLPTLTELPSERPSTPINIPARKIAQGHVSRPTTPLTARAPQGQYFTSWHKIEPRISESLTPYYSSRVKGPSENQDASAAHRSFATMSPRSESSPRYRTSSPLCSKMPVPVPSAQSSQKPRTPPQRLNLAGLPKYHPANFQAPPSPLSPRSITSQPRPGRGSDAKQQLLQYQRDIINDAAKASRSLASSSVSTKPNPPRLVPRGSPGGPMTPLMLEGASDYLIAGSSSLPAGFKEGDGREFVERLVRRENERRNYPGARSGSVSPALSLSPAVSPAGGRG